jgi:hypothetical protein
MMHSCSASGFSRMAEQLDTPVGSPRESTHLVRHNNR